MKKLIITLALVITSFINIPIASAKATATLEIDMPTVVKIGESFKAVLSIQSINDIEGLITGIDGEVYFNDEYLSCSFKSLSPFTIAYSSNSKKFIGSIGSLDERINYTPVNMFELNCNTLKVGNTNIDILDSAVSVGTKLAFANDITKTLTILDN